MRFSFTLTFLLLACSSNSENVDPNPPTDLAGKGGTSAKGGAGHGGAGYGGSGGSGGSIAGTGGASPLGGKGGSSGDPFNGGGKGGDPFNSGGQGGKAQGGNPQGGNPQGGNPQGGNPQGGNPQGGNPQGGNSQGGKAQGGNPQGGNSQGGKAQGGQGGNPQGGQGGSGEDPFESYRQHCVDKINEYRATVGLPPYERWKEGEACADQMADHDADVGKAHDGFQKGICGGGSGQNECPGYGSPSQLDYCLGQMWAEGPAATEEWDYAHGHYQNMVGNYTVNGWKVNFKKVACGFSSKGWFLQNFH